MTYKIFQAQAPAGAERPAIPTGTTLPSQDRAGREAAIVELTDADLQAVTGGGDASGIGGDISR